MVQWLGFGAFSTVVQVQLLIWELRSHIKPLHAMAKKKKKRERETVIQGVLVADYVLS